VNLCLVLCFPGLQNFFFQVFSLQGIFNDSFAPINIFGSKCQIVVDFSPDYWGLYFHFILIFSLFSLFSSYPSLVLVLYFICLLFPQFPLIFLLHFCFIHFNLFWSKIFTKFEPFNHLIFINIEVSIISALDLWISHQFIDFQFIKMVISFFFLINFF